MNCEHLQTIYVLEGDEAYDMCKLERTLCNPEGCLEKEKEENNDNNECDALATVRVDG